MPLIVTISGSPSPASRTLLLAELVGAKLRGSGVAVESINVRDLPAEDLLGGRADGEAIRRAVGLVERAEGVVVATPIYKAAYAGALKTFLDLLPQFALAGKAVLPLATGGTLAHVLALDYALRPVLASLGARHVVNGLFVLDKQLERTADGGLDVDPQTSARLDPLVKELVASVRAQLAGAEGPRPQPAAP
jgi:FMN reductase